jgi:D-alanyl-D-alanine carboxypeptidase/D-alanyl-D-alanine-endopeptidase (penicillin-binding protein 4)
MGRLRRRGPLRGVFLVVLALLGAACASHPAPVVSTPTAAVDPAAALNHDLSTIFSTGPASGALWGVRVESLDYPGAPLFALNPDHLFVPASNMKLLTVAAAATRLGWDHTVETTVRATTPLGTDGIIRGDLVLRGGGDPTIGNRPTSRGSVSALAESLWERGVRRVEGRVVGDASAFAREPLGEGWAWDDLSFAYSAPAGALIYNENDAQISIAPGASAGTAAAVALVDVDSGLHLRSSVVTGAPASSTDLDVSRGLASDDVEVRGTIAADHGPVMRYAAVNDASRYFASALRSALVTRGIVVRGPAVNGDDSPAGPVSGASPVLATLTSPTLDIIATRLLKVSQNLYAETFLRQLDATPNHQASVSGAETALRQVLSGFGVSRGGFAQSDGSGLSRYNLVTPTAFVQVLTAMARNAQLSTKWMAALPIGGADGTLQHRLTGTAAEGRVHAKTGSLSAVRALSGYLEAAAGEHLVFSILANNYADPVTSEDIEKTIDSVVVRLVGFKRD